MQTIKNTIQQAISYQQQHDHIWNQNIAHNKEYQQIKNNLIEHAKHCTAQIKAHESANESTKADEFIKIYSQIIEIYREFYYH